MKHLVGLCGPKGCGKTAVAHTLQAALIDDGMEAVVLSFAAPIKAMLTALYVSAGVDSTTIERALYGSMKEEPDSLLGGKSPRQAMQTLGTEWGRELITEHLWRDLTFSRATAAVMASTVVIIDDVRFESEAKGIAYHNGTVIEVMRDGFKASDEHASEYGVDTDHGILNNGPILEAVTTIRMLLKI